MIKALSQEYSQWSLLEHYSPGYIQIVVLKDGLCQRCCWVSNLQYPLIDLFAKPGSTWANMTSYSNHNVQLHGSVHW